MGRVGEGIEVTAVLYEVHILSRQSLTRKERLEGKSGLLGMINMIWGRGFGRKLGGGRVGEGIEVTAVLYEVHWRLLLTVLLFSVHL